MGNRTYLRHGRQPRAERIVQGLQGFLLPVEISKIVVHEADEPNALVDFLNTVFLSGQHDGWTGHIEAEVRGLSASVAEVRHSSPEQHRENRARLESIGERVEKIEADMKPVAKTVATMQPIVAGYAVAHWKIARSLDLVASKLT